LSVEQVISYSSIGQNEPNLNQIGYNEDSLERLLLDEAEAEQLYNRIMEDFTDKCINVMLNDIESFSKTRQISDIQYALSTDEGYHKSPDVCKVEIPVSEVLTNYAAQMWVTRTYIKRTM
jgi:hypothetical protein